MDRKRPNERVGRPEEPLVLTGNWKDNIKLALSRGKYPKAAKPKPKKKRGRS